MCVCVQIKLESIGAEDIYAGNPKLILGLIWTIILRFQIQEIEIECETVANESKEKRSAKEALLVWVQRKTYGYQSCHVHDFSASWRSGMAFNALIHSQRSDLFDYNALDPAQHLFNLEHAFGVAEHSLGIARLLDAEDMDVERPDEKSVLTYVSSFYHVFAKMKSEAVGGKRVAKVIASAMEVDALKSSYERQCADLIAWIERKSVEVTQNIHTFFQFNKTLNTGKV